MPISLLILCRTLLFFFYFILVLFHINIISMSACKIYIIELALTSSNRLNDFELVRAMEPSLPRVHSFRFLFLFYQSPLDVIIHWSFCSLKICCSSSSHHVIMIDSLLTIEFPFKHAIAVFTEKHKIIVEVSSKQHQKGFFHMWLISYAVSYMYMRLL